VSFIRRGRGPLLAGLAISLLGLAGHVLAYPLWRVSEDGVAFRYLTAPLRVIDLPARLVWELIGFGYGFEVERRSPRVLFIELVFYGMVLFVVWSLVFEGLRRAISRVRDRPSRASGLVLIVQSMSSLGYL